MTKLYTITVSYDFVVVGEDVEEAYDNGMYYLREALSDMPRDSVGIDVVPGVHADGWDDECIPYGGDGNTRTGEYK
jgi:hypothetical protein